MTRSRTTTRAAPPTGQTEQTTMGVQSIPRCMRCSIVGAFLFCASFRLAANVVARAPLRCSESVLPNNCEFHDGASITMYRPWMPIPCEHARLQACGAAGASSRRPPQPPCPGGPPRRCPIGPPPVLQRRACLPPFMSAAHMRGIPCSPPHQGAWCAQSGQHDPHQLLAIS